VTAGFGRVTVGTGTCAGTDVPLIWSCGLASYGGGDGCTCGCGAHDPDCSGASSAACAANGCATAGSCAKTCADVAGSDNARCADTPAGWTCSPLYYRDGTICDCGCGAPDPDCLETTAEACDYCNDPGSCTTDCTDIDELDNSTCDIPGWTCDPGSYSDGTLCDCGCGVVDPDCRDQTGTSCQRCAETGSCATTDCSQIDAQLNSICD
jgi:hypothetical protein